MLKNEIAGRLEQTFSQLGFAESSVAQLKAASGVSLRTLYKYYPSKEDMIVAALEHRHQRYITFLLADSPSTGLVAVHHTFTKLGQWMEDDAPNGCMSVSALNAFPDHDIINQTVRRHKAQVRDVLAKQSAREDLADQLFLLHEGLSSAFPVIGNKALNAAKLTAASLLEEN